MVNDFLKMGPHDVGGESSHSIDTRDHGMKYWEKFSNGLRMALTSTKIITLDELRLTAESFGQKYFEIHHTAKDVFEAVHPREMELGTASMASLVYLIDKYGL